MDSNEKMSTKIDDLPIVIVQEEKKQEPVSEKLNESTEIKYEIKKKDEPLQQKFSLFNTIKKEVNEENLLLFALFFILNTIDINQYIAAIPFLSQYILSSWNFILIKSLIFLLLYILLKNFLLPKIQI